MVLYLLVQVVWEERAVVSIRLAAPGTAKILSAVNVESFSPFGVMLILTLATRNGFSPRSPASAYPQTWQEESRFEIYLLAKNLVA